MKRDLGLIRDILLELHKGDGKLQGISNTTDEQFLFHAHLLVDAEFIEMDEAKNTITRLTWRGHDIAESIQDLDIRNINWKDFTKQH